MSRGGLIFPFIVEYRQLDLSSSSYDSVLREPSTTDDGSELGLDGRAETTITVPGQIEPTAFGRLDMLATGNSPDAGMVIVHHFADLERLGLVDANGMATIKVGDRLSAVYEWPAGSVKVLDVPDPPGLYVTESMPGGFGLGRKRNLLLVRLDDRKQGVA
jgi:hypothetical protein